MPSPAHGARQPASLARADGPLPPCCRCADASSLLPPPAVSLCVPPQVMAAAPKRQRTRQVAENMGTSLLEYFTEAQIQTHVAKLQSKEPGAVQGEALGQAWCRRCVLSF